MGEVMNNYFTNEELACPCGRKECDAPKMDITTMFKLIGLRREFAEPMTINSGSRCKVQNAKVGGAKDSQHLYGRAVDVHCPDGLYMRRLLMLALKHGFSIGIKKRMIHLDTRPGVPVVFGY